MSEKKIISKTIQLKVYSLKEVSMDWKNLCAKAKDAASKAYAVYSNFKVGAAVLLEDGSIITGNNQENAAYPSGLCAERTVMFYVHSQYPDKKIKTIALYSPDATSLITPCGACRQVMLEYENVYQQHIVTLILYNDEVYVVDNMKDWLPFEFSGKTMK